MLGRDRVREAKEFLGAEVWGLFLRAIAVGFFLFAVESSFIMVLQGFLRSLGLMQGQELLLPLWYPESMVGATMFLMLFGVLRGAAYLFKAFLAGATHQAFLRQQRARILEYGLLEASTSSSHEVINMFNERVSQAAGTLNAVSQLLLTGTSGLLFLVLGFSLAPKEMALGLFLLSLILFPLRFLNDRIERAGQRVVKESEDCSRLLAQGLRHQFFLRIYGLLGEEIAKGKASLAAYERDFKKYYFVFALKNAVPLIAGSIVISVVAFMSREYFGTSAVKLISFFYIFVRLAQAASEANNGLSELRLQLPGFRLLIDWNERLRNLKLRTATKGTQLNRVNKPGAVEIRAEGLAFGYPGGPNLFRGLDFKAGRGESVLIKGESGSGKSTLLTLVLGLNEPSQGRLLINGESISTARDWLYEQVAYVGPEPYLIAGTVRANLLYGNHRVSAVSDGEIWAALENAQIAAAIRELPLGLQEILYEHTQLSTGQRQRLAIARAMLRKPSLLILDEASANLDSVTEQKFLEALKELLPRVTALIISHKPTFDSLATQRIELGAPV